MALSRKERRRVEGKFVHFLKFRHSLRRLMECEHFAVVRDALLEKGFPQWHVLDGATQALANYRIDPPNWSEFRADSQAEFRRRGERMMAYMETFYETGDEPMLDCDAWTEEGLERIIRGMGLAWLSRQHLLPRENPINDELVEQLLRTRGFYEAVPVPHDFPYSF